MDLKDHAEDKRLENIYQAPYAGIIRQVQRVGCLIPLSFLKLPGFRLSQKIYYTATSNTINQGMSQCTKIRRLTCGRGA